MASSRAIVNWLLDVTLGASLLVALWTAALLLFVFPAGPDAQGVTLFGADREAWLGFHFGCLIVFAILALIHVMLHWSWLCGVATQYLSRRWGRRVLLDEPTQTIVGVALLLAALHLLGGLLLLAMLLIEYPAGA